MTFQNKEMSLCEQEIAEECKEMVIVSREIVIDLKETENNFRITIRYC